MARWCAWRRNGYRMPGRSFGVAQLMADAVRTGGLACEVFGDGMAIRIDAATVYEPDAQLRCGAPLDD